MSIDYLLKIDTQLNIEETVGDIDDTVKGILQVLLLLRETWQRLIECIRSV